MKYQSDDLYNYEQKSWWIFEILKNIRHIKDKPRDFYRNEWFEFHPLKWGVHTTLEKAGYFDERPQLNFYVSQLIGVILIPFLIFNFSWWLLLLTLTSLTVGVGKIYLMLPFKTGINDCESPKWGFYIYYHGFLSETNLVICKGKKNKYIKFPWNLEWYRTSYLKKTEGISLELGVGEWEHEFTPTKLGGKNKEFWDRDKWKGILWEKTYPYTYVLNSGEIQERQATIKVKEMEWRRRWLMWTPLFNQVIRSIDVEFDKEVGERTGSWKGGTVGCGYEMNFNDTPFTALCRMERERKFN